jgi:hypothetical protein
MIKERLYCTVRSCHGQIHYMCRKGRELMYSSSAMSIIMQAMDQVKTGPRLNDIPPLKSQCLLRMGQDSTIKVLSQQNGIAKYLKE